MKPARNCRGYLATICRGPPQGSSNPTPCTSRRTPELRSATLGRICFGMPGVVWSAIASQPACTYLQDVVSVEKLSGRICAIDLETFVWARERLDEAQIVKCLPPRQEFRVEPQTPLKTLLGAEQVDAHRVIEEQIGGMLAQDVAASFAIKELGIAGVCVKFGRVIVTPFEDSRRAGAASRRASAANIIGSFPCDGEHDLSLRVWLHALQHDMSVARSRERQDCPTFVRSFRSSTRRAISARHWLVTLTRKKAASTP